MNWKIRCNIGILSIVIVCLEMSVSFILNFIRHWKIFMICGWKKIGLQSNNLENYLSMYYRRNERLHNLLYREVNQKNTESIVDIFIQTMNTVDMCNALDVYMTLHIIAVWSVKNKQARKFPCMTPGIEKIMDTLYDEIHWKSDKKTRYLTPSMVFVHLGAPCSLKDIYEMYEDDQDDYCTLIIERVRKLNSFLSD